MLGDLSTNSSHRGVYVGHSEKFVIVCFQRNLLDSSTFWTSILPWTFFLQPSSSSSLVPTFNMPNMQMTLITYPGTKLLPVPTDRHIRPECSIVNASFWKITDEKRMTHNPILFPPRHQARTCLWIIIHIWCQSWTIRMVKVLFWTIDPF